MPVHCFFLELSALFYAGFGGCDSSKSAAPGGVRKVFCKTTVVSQGAVGSIIHARGIPAQVLAAVSG